MQVVRSNAFRAVPWKNGGGVTHEAARMPADGAAFRWRLSIAEVTASGPFSDFSGYRRSMVLLRGRDLRLRFATGTTLLLREPGDLVHFDGGVRAEGELLAGPCMDLNLIVAADLPDAGARVVRVERPLGVAREATESLLIFAVDGTLAVEPPAGPPEQLSCWDLCVVADAAAGTVTLHPSGSGPPTQVFLANLSDNR